MLMTRSTDNEVQNSAPRSLKILSPMNEQYLTVIVISTSMYLLHVCRSLSTIFRVLEE